MYSTILAGRGFIIYFNLQELAKTCQGMVNVELPRHATVYLYLELEIGSRVGLKLAKNCPILAQNGPAWANKANTNQKYVRIGPTWTKMGNIRRKLVHVAHVGPILANLDQHFAQIYPLLSTLAQPWTRCLTPDKIYCGLSWQFDIYQPFASSDLCKQ
jgi:hypothetical protein